MLIKKDKYNKTTETQLKLTQLNKIIQLIHKTYLRNQNSANIEKARDRHKYTKWSKYFCTLPIKAYFKMWEVFCRIKGISVVKIIAGISGIEKTSNARRTGPGAVLPGKSKGVCTHSISLPKNWQEDKNYHRQLFRL